VSLWGTIFLGVIAVATLAMAIAQLGVIVVAGKIARRVDRLANQIEHDLKPLLASVNAIGRDASRTVALAAAQAERADRLFADLAVRIEQTVAAVQASLVAPAREGRALMVALRAAVAAVRDARRGARAHRAEDEDALFI
jgi:hypothetical protein